MRAIITSVDYNDFLRVTLPANRQFFESVVIITSTADAPNVRPIADANEATVYVTDAFYAREARFNKGAALEETLDAIGREGWLTFLDADVIIPAGMKWPGLVPGRLYSPLRRMAPWPLAAIPPESEWGKLPEHPNTAEFAGYFQTMHASDPVLEERPWFPTEFRHAGTYDSIFQGRWPRERKTRLPFHVLHLGESGANWFGRATADVAGHVPADAELKRRLTREMWAARRGKSGDARFDAEKIR